MTDIKAIIAALTTERNAIDRAIHHLHALSAVGQADDTPKKKRLSGRKKRAPWTAERRAHMAAIVEAKRARRAEHLAVGHSNDANGNTNGAIQ